MAANLRTEMRIPTRSAPHPPVNSTPQRNAVWSSTNNTFVPTLPQQPFQKKKPPPRPPPPKVNQLYSQTQKEKFKKQVRPTEFFTNFFGRKRNEHSSTTQLSSQIQGTILQPQNSNGTVCLINFSPPGSPTFTTRSSSDGISVDSFGSDGNSNPSVFTSSGNTSQTESAFEDDFDFFGIYKKPQNSWKFNSVTDSFGPLEVTNDNTLKLLKHEGDTHCFAFKTNGHGNNQVLSNVQSLPTIIRAKPPKPPAPKIFEKRVDQNINHFNTEPRFLNDTTVPFANALSLNITESWQNDYKDSLSPPMPTIPPPALPPECLTEVRDNLSITTGEPYGIALYDFSLTQIGDLPFKEGDVIKLVRKVNDDWMEGRIGNQQGIFPMNFIDIKVPLPDILENVVTAIYPFKGETAEDLTFSEGDKITVLSRISKDWLYGECSERKGQFPVNYVNRIPHNISLPY